MRNILAAAMVAYEGGAAAAADPSPICADRPGKATGTCTVPARRWQVEAGIGDWTLQKNAGARDVSLAIGETTVKYGLNGASDIELDVTPWQRSASRLGRAHESASGIGDVSVLYKQRMTAPDAPVQVAAKPFVKLPTAPHSLGNGKWEGGLLIPIGYALPSSSLGIALTPELDWTADADGRGHHAAMAQVIGVGWQATGKLNLSAELWGAWDWDPAGTTRQASADAAAAYLLGNDVQVDAGANVGLNRATPDVEFYGGVSVRF